MEAMSLCEEEVYVELCRMEEPPALEEYQKRECEKMLQRLFLGDCSKMRSCLAQVEREALKV